MQSECQGPALGPIQPSKNAMEIEQQIKQTRDTRIATLDQLLNLYKKFNQELIEHLVL